MCIKSMLHSYISRRAFLKRAPAQPLVEHNFSLNVMCDSSALQTMLYW